MRVAKRVLWRWLCASVCALAGAAALGGCNAPRAETWPQPLPVAARDDGCAFAPVSLQIHPLTHIDQGSESPAGTRDGECTLVLHFELRDAYGDAVKGLGSLKVELYRLGTGVTPGIESQELVWDVPELRDVESNTLRYDRATRTYRVPLGAPRWVADWIAKAGVDPGSGPSWLKVRAVLNTGDEASENYLDDEFVIQG